MKRSKKIWSISLGILILLVIIGRLLLTPFALKKLNAFGLIMNPVYTLHAEDMSISLLTATITLHDGALTLRETDQKYMKVSRLILKIDVLESITHRFSYKSWELVDWVATITPEVSARYAAQKKWKKPKVIPIKKIIANDAKLILVKNGETITLFPINGTFEDFSPDGLTKFKFESPSKLAHMNIEGVYDPSVRPIPWKLELVLKDFKLIALNDMFKHKSPVVFKAGHADVYFQGDSRNRVIKGVLKPFIEDVVVEGNKRELKVDSPIMVGIAGDIITWFMSDKKNKTMGLVIPFTSDHGEFALDKSFSLKKAIKQMTKHPPERGFKE